MKSLKLIFVLLAIACFINCNTSKQATASINDYKFETVAYDVQDSILEDLLYAHMDKTKFKKGQSIKESTFVKERERIVKLIRENKDSDFSADKVSFEIDTTLSKNKYSVTAIIK